MSGWKRLTVLHVSTETVKKQKKKHRHSPLSYQWRFNPVSTARHPALLMSRRLTAAMMVRQRRRREKQTEM